MQTIWQVQLKEEEIKLKEADQATTIMLSKLEVRPYFLGIFVWNDIASTGLLCAIVYLQRDSRDYTCFLLYAQVNSAISILSQPK